MVSRLDKAVMIQYIIEDKIMTHIFRTHKRFKPSECVEFYHSFKEELKEQRTKLLKRLSTQDYLRFAYETGYTETLLKEEDMIYCDEITREIYKPFESSWNKLPRVDYDKLAKETLKKTPIKSFFKNKPKFDCIPVWRDGDFNE